ncbi:hypothetical protein MPSEU_000890400 [Mayamaea pseudoterrestris]|nr:hypothetical protein MPSEU_000890400 [Mayamaea pseudoterrestris]
MGFLSTMNVAINQMDTNPLPRNKNSTSQLRRVRTSKVLASEANQTPKGKGHSRETSGAPNPTDFFTEYILGTREACDGQQRGVCLPNQIKGNATPESESKSLVAMIHGIFGGAEMVTSRSSSNLRQEENALPFRSHHVGGATMMHQSIRREGRQEDGGTSDDSAESKTRSRGIPIQRSPPSHASSEDSSSSESPDDACKETYDWATWRMYNRIIDHRAKYPVNASYLYSSSPGASTGHSPHFSSPLIDGMVTPFDDLRSQLLRNEAPVLEGEVFHLEM